MGAGQRISSTGDASTPSESPDLDSDRRDTLGFSSKACTAIGLTAAYGALAAMMGRFIHPSGPPAKGWMCVTRLARLAIGEALVFRTPSGATVNVARQGEGTHADAFIALSSTCPHLGCQVHWQAQENRFFCPCHNGIFSADGKGIGGPPGDAGQSLARYPLKVEEGLLYIEVDFDEIAMGWGEVIEPPAAPPGPGHDPCLYPDSCSDCRSSHRSTRSDSAR